TQAPTQAPTEAPTQVAQAPTQAPTQPAAPTQAPTQPAAPTQAPTQPAQASPVAGQPQGQQARSFLEPVNPAAAQLPATSGGGLPALALALGALGLGARAARRWLKGKE
ncbi:MAG TPA: hypothetical protein PKD53_34665, partial [Chloroflexaceae bacterium]|nr:hypothetical protein [Chloroflexaceae bacterium]